METGLDELNEQLRYRTSLPINGDEFSGNHGRQLPQVLLEPPRLHWGTEPSGATLLHRHPLHF